MDYAKLGPILVKAMQEQEEKIENLQAENQQLKLSISSDEKQNELIQTMKAEIDEMKGRLNMLTEK
jgi:hypothetical protein